MGAMLSTGFQIEVMILLICYIFKAECVFNLLGTLRR